MNKRGENKAGQITLFIILAIAVVLAIVVFFLVREKIIVKAIPSQLEPVYSYFLQCIELETIEAAKLAGSQAGYIYVPEFKPGSNYAPFSSQLNFLGFPVPYWYYLTGNNIIKEQVPEKKQIEEQLNEYLAERIYECDFSEFRQRGFVIEIEKPKVKAKINENNINVDVDSKLSVSLENFSATQSTYTTTVDSKLGKFYELAKKIYDKEKTSSFLENYGVDVLRLYAPVDGAELSCSPLIWNAAEIANTLQNALEANIQAIKLKGDYYTLTKKENKYFVQDIATDETVNFLYMKNWPSRIEIWPVENSIMLAEPVGLQEGLGVLGFCYVPYHFVYDIYFPVLIQIYNQEEIFQFPLAVIIDKSMPRNPLEATAPEKTEFEVCKYKNTDVNVYTYNQKLEPIESDISFSCLDETCDIGKTKISGNEARLSAKFPQCVNGFILAKAENYATKRYQISTNKESEANILLNKLYELELELKIDGKTTSDLAIISLESDENSYSFAFPEQTKIKLSEGLYNVTVHVYRNSTITIPESTTHKCVEVPRTGILGIFGSTKEQCFEITMPSQTLSGALTAGGRTIFYLTEHSMEISSKLEINAPSLPQTQTLEQISQNYELFEKKYLDITLK